MAKPPKPSFDLFRTLVESLGKHPEHLVVVVVVAIALLTVYEVTKLAIGGR